MPELTPTKLFLKDIAVFQSNQALHKKIIKALAFLQENPFHPGLHIIDPKAYSESGTPDWNKGIILLRILVHDDLYKKSR